MSGPVHAVPSATYRVQLREGLTLDGVVEEGWLDHAHALGVSHLYLSPVLTATEGSTHGYDVVDPRHVDPALGGDEAFRRLALAARARGMGLVVDIVPNHMSLDQRGNRWWWDVLRHGPASRYAGMFDIDWEHPERRLRGSVLLPVLPDHYGRVLEAGDLVPGRRGHEAVVRHGGIDFPLEPASTAALIREVAERVDDDVLRLLARSLTRLDDEDVAERAAEVDALDELLAARLASDPQVAETYDAVLAELAADVDSLDELLSRQHYRLAHWRAAERDLGYRRFFDVNGLIGVRVDDPEVLELTHRAVRRWVDEGLVDGLRVDHPDGLASPARYFERLAELAPDAWIVAEKILEPGEELPPWQVDGTTGYDAGELVARLFLDGDGLDALSTVRDELVGEAPPLEELVRSSKLDVLHDVLAADLNRVTDLLLRLCEGERRHRDVTRHELHEALRELAASFGIYRSYVGAEGPADTDRRAIDAALADARHRRGDLDPELFDLLRMVLLGELDARTPLAARVRVRFEQLSAPAMAKGKEDTAWYRDVRLIGRNEVGADPAAPPLTVDAFHEAARRLSERWPRTMTALSTHDTKRSEDVRARLAALTGETEEWQRLVSGWFGRHEALCRNGAPSPTARMWLYQTLLGAFPIEPHRVREHMAKAVREAKVETSWVRPDEDYEAAVMAYVDAVTSDEVFVAELAGFLDQLGPRAERIALAQKLVQLTMPGVPDLYRGTEGWFARLTDPDNRRSPDLEQLDLVLDHVLHPAVHSDEAARFGVDHRKALVVTRALQLRARHHDRFVAPASYEALEVEGADHGRVLAFCRGGVAVTVAEVGGVGLPVDDARVRLPAGSWKVVLGADEDELELTGTVDVGRISGGWPGALLERVG